MKSSLPSRIPFLPLFSVALDFRLSQFSAANCNSGTWPRSHSSCRSSLYSLGVDPKNTPLPLLLRVDALLQRCVYRTVACNIYYCVPLLRVYRPLPSNGCFSASRVLALSKYAAKHFESQAEGTGTNCAGRQVWGQSCIVQRVFKFIFCLSVVE
jgi:hypothetical protein